MPNTIWTWPNSMVNHIIDGDSFVAMVTRDIGFHGTVSYLQKLRLNRINTPPAKTDLGIAATAETTKLLTGGPVYIETVSPYKYRDEWMAEVTLPDGRNLSDVLVAGGFAFYWDGTGPRPGG